MKAKVLAMSVSLVIGATVAHIPMIIALFVFGLRPSLSHSDSISMVLVLTGLAASLSLGVISYRFTYKWLLPHVISYESPSD